MCLMTLGPMFVNGGGGVGSVTAGMGGDPCASMEDLHGHPRVARVQLLTYQLKRHAVIMPFDLDVIIDIGSNEFQ